MNYKVALMSPLGLLPFGAQPATAADMPVKAKAPQATEFTPNWAGLYGGVNLGVVSDQSKLTGFRPTAGTGNNYCFAQDPTCSAGNSQTAFGILGGVQIGYNFQNANIVYGLEADIDLSSARKTTSGPDASATFGGTWTMKSGVEALSTLRARLGYAFDNATMIYATGGLAVAKMANSFQGASTPGQYTWSDTSWRTGYVVGGGLEYKFSQNWSVKGEGLFYDLGRKDRVSVGPPTGYNFGYGATDRMNGVVARLGLNYLFH
jgi:outer membrane immunogenic protein